MLFQWRLLFIGLWTEADRDGRLEDRPVRLKANLFPYDDLDVNEGLGCLVNAGLITRYEREGMRLIAIPKWAKHQQPHVREAQSQLPQVVTGGTAKVVSSTPDRGVDRGVDQGRSTALLLENFDRFWDVYPRKVGRDGALTVWRRLKPDAALTNQIIEAVRVQARHWDDPKYVPHPQTWLNKGRWKDEPERTSARHGTAPQPTRSPWVCPHVDECNHPTMCAGKNELPQKYPRKAAAAL